MKPALLHPPNKTILLIALVTWLVSGCQPDPTVPTPIPTWTASPTASEAITVYFIDPSDPNAASYRGGVDEILVDAIGQAQAAVDLAVYDLNLWSVRDALIAALPVEHDKMGRVKVDKLFQVAGFVEDGDDQGNLYPSCYVHLRNYNTNPLFRPSQKAGWSGSVYMSGSLTSGIDLNTIECGVP